MSMRYIENYFCFVLGLVLFFVTSSACADVYKCRSSDGKVEISSKPCPNGSKTEATQRDETITLEQREAAEKSIKRAKEYIAEREAAQALERASQPQVIQAETPPPPPPPPTYAPAPGTTIIVVDPVSRCMYDIERMNLPPGKRSEMIAACGPSIPRAGPTSGQHNSPGKGTEPGPKCVGKACPASGTGR